MRLSNIVTQVAAGRRTYNTTQLYNIVWTALTANGSDSSFDIDRQIINIINPTSIEINIPELRNIADSLNELSVGQYIEFDFSSPNDITYEMMLLGNSNSYIKILPENGVIFIKGDDIPDTFISITDINTVLLDGNPHKFRYAHKGTGETISIVIDDVVFDSDEVYTNNEPFTFNKFFTSQGYNGVAEYQVWNFGVYNSSDDSPIAFFVMETIDAVTKVETSTISAATFTYDIVSGGFIDSVSDNILIASQPRDAFVVVDQTAEFTVNAASRLPLTYTWYTVDGETRTVIPGQTTNTLIYTNPTLLEDTTSIECDISNASVTVTTDRVVLNVLEASTPVARPVPFLGYSQINASAVEITGIEFQDGLDADELDKEAPYAIFANVKLRVVAERIHTNKPVSDYMHGHIKWNMEYADGSQIEYNGEIKKVIRFNEETVVNPFTETYGPEFSAIVRKEGLYKVSVDVYFATENNQAVHDYAERIATIGTNKQTPYYFAGALGDNANDGRDPNGFVGPFDYEEATGIVSKVGAFTSYDHTVATGHGYDRENTNWIWLDGMLRRIVEKISNDAIRLDDAFKLGADATGLMSSTGPKGFLTSASQVTGDNVAIYLLTGTTHDIDSEITLSNRNGKFSIDTYGGSVYSELTSTSLPTNHTLIDFYSSISISIFPHTVLIGNVCNPEQENRSDLFSGVASSENLGSIRNVTIMDRTKDYNHGGSYTPSNTLKLHKLFWGIEYLGYGRKVIFPNSILASNGENYVDLETPFDVDAFRLKYDSDNASLKIYPNGKSGNGDDEYVYRRVTIPETGVVTRLFLESHRNIPATMPVYPTGTLVDIVEGKGNFFLISNSGESDRIAMIGAILEWECDLEVYDHFIYNNAQGNHNHYAWVYARRGNNVGMMFNTNNDYQKEQKYNTFHDNFGRQCTWMFEGGNGLNTADDNTFAEMYIVNNTGDETVKAAFGLMYIVRNAFIKNTKIHSTDARSIEFIDPAANTGNRVQLYELFDVRDVGFVIEDCDVMNYTAWVENGAFYSLEMHNNRFQNMGSDVKFISIDPNNPRRPKNVDSYFGYNTFYAPNDSNGLSFEIVGESSLLSLADFEIYVNSIPGSKAIANKSNAPDWVDGLNGDFERTLIPTYTGGDLVLEPTIGEAYSIDLSEYFLGPELVFVDKNNELPAGFSITGNILSGQTSDNTAGTFNLIISATNGYGTTDSTAIKFLPRYAVTTRLVADLAKTTHFQVADLNVAAGEEVEFDFYLDRTALLAAGTNQINFIGGPGNAGNNPFFRVGSLHVSNSTIIGAGFISECYINETPVVLGVSGNFNPFRSITTKQTVRIVANVDGFDIRNFLVDAYGANPTHGVSIANIRIRPRTENEIRFRVNSGGLDLETEASETSDSLVITFRNTDAEDWVSEV